MNTLHRSFRLLILTILLLGCNQPEEEPMPATFVPPSITLLTDIDDADDSYGNESIVIDGVVSPSGQGGWPGGNDDYEVHCFSFSAWKKLDEPTIQRELTILRPVPPEADYWDDFPKHSIQRIRVFLSGDEFRAVLEEPLPLDAPAPELEAIAQELQNPVIFPTEVFGDLFLNRSVNWFEGEATWNKQRVRVTFPVDEEQAHGVALKAAESLWLDQAKWKERIEKYAAEKLLAVKNDIWLEDDEPQVTSEQFIARMTLTSISFDSDGGFEFWFDDGDLFWGHSIMVSGNLNDGPSDAAFHG
ncbi:MAG: DUF2262 domain-containing protein [Planctomycetota bacterium]